MIKVSTTVNTAIKPAVNLNDILYDGRMSACPLL